jgi:class I fructose-bisphosphate aldolase
MKNLFAGDDRTVILPIDHGAALDVLPALANPGYVINRSFEAGADAVLTTFGIARRYEKELAGRGLILRMDGGNSQLGNTSGDALLYTLETAVKMGADGVACMGFLGTENEKVTLKNLAFLGEKCRDWGLPLMAEMLPGGFSDTPAKSAANVKLAARIGAELGASIIKTTYAGTAAEFKEIVDGCFVPVVILGGAHSNDFTSLLDTVQTSRDCGAAGVAIGRNIWGQKDPYHRMKALCQIIHEDVNASEAAAILKEKE